MAEETPDAPDPRFLGGQTGPVITDASRMMFVIAADWDGAVDVQSHISPADLAAKLRLIADHYETMAEAAPDGE